MKLEENMGCKSTDRDANMQNKQSQESDRVTETAPNTVQHNNTSNSDNHTSPISPSANDLPPLPTTPHGQGGLPHSSTDPNFRGPRPHSAHHHRQIGRILRVMGDGYCYSCGIALRQMGDQLSGEYEVRRALSTGDLPNSIKNS